MNKIFKRVWSASRGTCVAVAETTRASGKTSTGVSGALVATVLLSTGAGAQTLAVGALPTGGQVTAGQASIASQGSVMNVLQSSQRAAINWQSFNVGSGATVNFQQPNASAVTLNRVVGSERSVIDGALNANGNVYILNANGVLFNRNAQVNVGGLVASTLNISDADFMAGKSTFEATGQRGSIINLGTLTAANAGHIALLGQHVANEGVINATLGTAVLAAGDKVSLNFNGNSLVGVTVDRGTLNALVENKQAIIADGGLVTLTAKGLDQVMQTVVNNTGEIRAQTVQNQEGRIYLLGGMANDRVEVGGRLDASAPSGGNGGFVETSAANVQVKTDARVTTLAAQGNTGTWLLDPTDFTVTAGSGAQTSSGIGADALVSALAGGNFTIQTQSGGIQSGDVNINAPIAWSANTLTILAHGDINVNAVMTATGTSALALKFGWNGTSYDSTKLLRMGFADDQTFAGRIDFDRSGAGLLSINGSAYTLINSRAALQAINSALSGLFALSGNVDIAGSSGNPFSPIAGSSGQNFTGKFEGLGHIVNNLYAEAQYGGGGGLFGSTSGAAISNVGVTNAYVKDSGWNDVNGIGLLVGSGSNTSISNVYTTGSAFGVDAYGSTNFVGGVVGRLSGNSKLNRSYSTASISDAVNRGGLVGYLADTAKISDSYYAGATTTSAGGMVGRLEGPTAIIQNSFSIRSPLAQISLFYGSPSNAASNAVWDTTASGSSGGVGFGKTTSEMQALTTYQGMNWKIVGDNTLPVGYPILTLGADGIAWKIGTRPAVTDVSFTLSSISREYNGSQYNLASLWSASSIFGSSYSSWSLGTDYTFQYGVNTVAGFTNAGTYNGITVNVLKSGFAAASSGNTTGTFTITPKTLTLSATKVYDGSTALSGSQVTFGGLVGSETLSYSSATANSKNAGSGNYISAITLANGSNGGLASNYQLPTLDATNSPATITPKELTVTGTTVANKVFDGSTTVGATPGMVGGLVGSETVNTAATGELDSRSPGLRRATVRYTLSNGSNGGLANNYTVLDTSHLVMVSQDPTVENVTTIAAQPRLLTPESGQTGGKTTDVLLPASYVVSTAARLSTGVAQSAPGNVVAVPPTVSLPFAQGEQLAVLSTPKADEPTTPVSLSQARVMTGAQGAGVSDGTREVRVPVSRNSLAEIVNGGVKLPGGVEQQLFVVRK